MRFQFFLLLALAVSISSCDKDPSIEATLNPPTVLSGEIVTANFYGHLTNDHGEAVPDAAVRIGNKQTTTDQEGLWSIDNATVVKDQAFIQFASTSHHKGSRTLLVEEGNKYQVDVEMLAFTGNTSIDAATGGQVATSNGNASVTFPAGAFAKTDGTPYTGSVRVEAAYLDPNETSTSDRMPGDLRATTAEGNSRLLITYGMVSVELFGANDEPLQLADGQTATISLPVEGEAALTAPESIPLWYFDEATAQWIEEGSATLQNGSYVGEVSHFTFWNCDIPTDYIRLCGTVVFEGVDSTTAANLRLIIESTNWGNGYGFTDENGQFCGIVPANETLTFIVQGNCNQATYSVTIGPYAVDTDLGTIIVPLPQNLLTTVSGTASCNGTPLTSGAVRIYQGGRQITATIVEPDGTFSSSFVSCDTAAISVKVINYATLEESDEITYTYSNTINTGDIEACSQALDNYFEMIVDGDVQLGDSLFFRRDGFLAFMSGDGFTASEYFGFTFSSFNSIPDPTAVGTYTITPSPNQDDLTIISSAFPSGRISCQSTFDFTISTVATMASPYTVGQIGPFVETVMDSSGVSTDYTIQINFSAPTF